MQYNKFYDEGKQRVLLDNVGGELVQTEKKSRVSSKTS